MLQNWLKVAFANYKKNWLATVINITGLTIALSVFVLVTLFWNSEASYESWVPNKERTFVVEHGRNKNDKDDFMGFMSVSNVALANVARNIAEVEAAMSYSTDRNVLLSNNVKTITVEKPYVAENNFFDFFPLPLLQGSYHNCLKDENTIAVSENVANQLFGNTNVIGKHLSSKSMGRNFIIGAVYKFPETKTAIMPDMVIPYTKNEYMDMQNNYNSYNSMLMLRLKNIKDIPTVCHKIKIGYYDNLAIPNMLKYEKGKTAAQLRKTSVVELLRIDKTNLKGKTEWLMFNENKVDVKLLYILGGLTLLLLILSIVNYINLNTSIAIKRAKESGVRKALGATKKQIVKQLIIETTIICVSAFILSIILSHVLLPHMSQVLNFALPTHTSWLFYLAMLCITLVIAIICGIIPAFYIGNFKAVEVLKGNYAKSKSSTWIRRTILILQLTISSFFITCGIITYKQVSYLINKNLGFKGEQVVIVTYADFSNTSPQKYNLAGNLFKKIQGVKYISTADMAPGVRTTNMNKATFENKHFETYYSRIDYDYFNILNIKLLSGRYLSPKISADTISNCIVNNSFIKEMHLTPEQAVGKTITQNNTNFMIVGVVNDFHFKGFDEKIKPTIFYNYLYLKSKGITPHVFRFLVKIYADNIPNTIKQMEKTWTADIEKDYPLQYEFVDKQFSKYFEKSQRQLNIFFTLTIAVLLVSLLGLFALSSFMIQQRLREVAIRKTLGAESKELIFKLTKNYLILAATGVLISIPFAYYFMNKWLSGFAYRIDMPWLPYMLSFILLLALTFAVVSIKARAATKVKVIKWLKYE